MMGRKIYRFIYLIFETSWEHLISLIQNKHSDAISTKWLSPQHIKHTTWSSDNDMDPSWEYTLILTNTGSSHTCVDLNAEVVTKCAHDLLNLLCEFSSGCQDQGLALSQTVIELLQNAGTKGGGFSSSGLGLLNDIKSLAERNNSPLLDSRGFLKTLMEKRR